MNYALLWLRRDLRLDDHPALHRLLADGYTPIPVYIHAPEEEWPWAPGAASQWWLHHSLQALNKQLQELGSGLIVRRGSTWPAMQELLSETGARAVYWHRRYEPSMLARDGIVSRCLTDGGFQAHSLSGNLLVEPAQLLNQMGSAYRVFSPFWRALRPRLEQLGPALDGPAQLPAVHCASMRLEDLDLLPKPRWDAGLAAHCTPGEAGAQAALASFSTTALSDYAEQRDRPDRVGTSALSAHLHFGEISLRRIVAELAGSPGAEAFLRELGWRDFSYYLLWHFPHTVDGPFNPRFERFPWLEVEADQLAAWQRGRTGIPIVDAGMRQLWHCGWMHNRVRMLVASFLTKNLRYHWLHGARWFWETLVDADLANNSQGWQWTAGTGADAAPYFRIFNPVTQGQRFDPDGDYVRRWVPELRELSTKDIHQPWVCGGVEGYPSPIVDLRQTRESALAAFKSLKEQ